MFSDATNKLPYSFILLFLATWISISSPAVHAQVVLDGTYSKGYSTNGSFTSGYATTSGHSYTIVSGAIFRNNDTGLNSSESATITVGGGTFDNNKSDGLLANQAPVIVTNGTFISNGNGLFADNSPVTITGGVFNNNLISGLDADSSTVTITNATFQNNKKYGLYAEAGSNVTINGGTFSGNGKFGLHVQGGSIVTLVGMGIVFDGLPTVTTRVATHGATFTGFVHGTLRDNRQPTHISYEITNGGRIHVLNITHHQQ